MNSSSSYLPVLFILCHDSILNCSKTKLLENKIALISIIHESAHIKLEKDTPMIK